MNKKKSWKEKLEDNHDLPKVVKTPKGTMAIPCPKEIYELMMAVPKGKLNTVGMMREKIAKKYKADLACPLTTGIFSWMAANAAEEMGKPLPYWRTLKSEGEINEKYPGGVEKQKELLEKEGFKVIKKGKKTVVEDFEKYLG